jgi:hypothetical protein
MLTSCSSNAEICVRHQLLIEPSRHQYMILPQSSCCLWMMLFPARGYSAMLDVADGYLEYGCRRISALITRTQDRPPCFENSQPKVDHLQPLLNHDILPANAKRMSYVHKLRRLSLVHDLQCPPRDDCVPPDAALLGSLY